MAETETVRIKRDPLLAEQLGTLAVVIPAHQARIENGMLTRAVESIKAQTYLPNSVTISIDEDGLGAAATRQDALSDVEADWVAFLDSDDEMLPEHLETLARCAVASGADYVYSWFCIVDADGRRRPLLDPFPGVFGQPFDPEHPVQTTVTTLVRRELAQSVGFVRPDKVTCLDCWHANDGAVHCGTCPCCRPTPTGHPAGEDWRFTLGCIEAGAKIVHVPAVTWLWHHHGLNSSGQPGRGDA